MSGRTMCPGGKVSRSSGWTVNYGELNWDIVLLTIAVVAAEQTCYDIQKPTFPELYNKIHQAMQTCDNVPIRPEIHRKTLSTPYNST